MVLSVKMIEALKPRAAPYKVGDQNGLYLYVAPTGSKSWRANYVLDGKQKTITYGLFPKVSLAAAREKNRAPKTTEVTCRTFDAVFQDWLKVKLAALKNPKHKGQVANTIERFVIPEIGNKAMKDIQRTELVALVKSIAARGTVETAERVAGRIRMIFDYALDCGDIDAHSAAGLTRVIAAKKSVPMPSIKPTEAGRLLYLINGYEQPVTRLGLLLAAYCFPRDQEVRSLRFSHIKRDESVWVVPEEHMKMGIPHVIPLSRQVLKLIPEFAESDVVLESPTRPGHSISENTLLFALYRLGYRGLMTTHGFRSLASSVLNESGLFSSDAIERQLSHKETDETRRAYNRAQYLPERIRMMQWYADWLDTQLSSYTKTLEKPAVISD